MFRSLSLFLSLASLALAQNNAAITGRVSDPEGAQSPKLRYRPKILPPAPFFAV